MSSASHSPSSGSHSDGEHSDKSASGDGTTKTTVTTTRAAGSVVDESVQQQTQTPREGWASVKQQKIAPVPWYQRIKLSHHPKTALERAKDAHEEANEYEEEALKDLEALQEEQAEIDQGHWHGHEIEDEEEKAMHQEALDHQLVVCQTRLQYARAKRKVHKHAVNAYKKETGNEDFVFDCGNLEDFDEAEAAAAEMHEQVEAERASGHREFEAVHQLEEERRAYEAMPTDELLSRIRGELYVNVHVSAELEEGEEKEAGKRKLDRDAALEREETEALEREREDLAAIADAGEKAAEALLSQHEAHAIADACRAEELADTMEAGLDAASSDPPSDETRIDPDIDLLLTTGNDSDDRGKLAMVVEALAISEDHGLRLEEVQLMFHHLLGVPLAEIPEDHEEVASFLGLQGGEIVERLAESLSSAQIEEYYALHFPDELTPAEAAEAERARREAKEDERVKLNLITLELELLQVDVLDQVRKLLQGEHQRANARSETLALLCSEVAVRVPVRMEDERRRIESIPEDLKALQYDVMSVVSPRESPSLLRPLPDRRKVERIIDALDVDGSGDLTAGEVKVLLSRMLGIPAAHIPDDHFEVQSLVGLPRVELVNKLTSDTPKHTIDLWYQALFPDDYQPALPGSPLSPKQAGNLMDELVRLLELLRGQIKGRHTLPGAVVEEVEETFREMSESPYVFLPNASNDTVGIDPVAEAAAAAKESAPRHGAMTQDAIQAREAKMRKIVAALDENGDGSVSVEEAKALFGTLLQMEIPEDHPATAGWAEEVWCDFAGLPSEEMVQRLLDTLTEAEQDKICDLMFPGDMRARVLGEIQKSVRFYLNRALNSDFDQANERAEILQSIQPELRRYSQEETDKDKKRLWKIVRAIDVDDDGELAAHEVKALFGRLFEIPSSEIPDDHPEIVAFTGLAPGEMVEKLHKSLTRPELWQYYAVSVHTFIQPSPLPLPRSLWPPSPRSHRMITHPQAMFPEQAAAEKRAMMGMHEIQAEMDTERHTKRRVTQIVQALDISQDGQLSAAEVKILFSRLLGISVEEIPDEHEEVQSFAGLTTEAMVERLCASISPEELFDYYAVRNPLLLPPLSSLFGCVLLSSLSLDDRSCSPKKPPQSDTPNEKLPRRRSSRRSSWLWWSTPRN